MKPYIPSKLPLKNLDYKQLFPLVGEANAQLVRYDGLLQGVMNPEVMLSPLTNEEAVLSSSIVESPRRGTNVFASIKNP